MYTYCSFWCKYKLNYFLISFWSAYCYFKENNWFLYAECMSWSFLEMLKLVSYYHWSLYGLFINLCQLGTNDFMYFLNLKVFYFYFPPGYLEQISDEMFLSSGETIHLSYFVYRKACNHLWEKVKLILQIFY